MPKPLSDIIPQRAWSLINQFMWGSSARMGSYDETVQSDDLHDGDDLRILVNANRTLITLRTLDRDIRTDANCMQDFILNTINQSKTYEAVACFWCKTDNKPPTTVVDIICLCQKNLLLVNIEADPNIWIKFERFAYNKDTEKRFNIHFSGVDTTRRYNKLVPMFPDTHMWHTLFDRLPPKVDARADAFEHLTPNKRGGKSSMWHKMPTDLREMVLKYAFPRTNTVEWIYIKKILSFLLEEYIEWKQMHDLHSCTVCGKLIHQ